MSTASAKRLGKLLARCRLIEVIGKPEQAAVVTVRKMNSYSDRNKIRTTRAEAESVLRDSGWEIWIDDTISIASAIGIAFGTPVRTDFWKREGR